jgi:hypothetical protein
MVTNSTTVMTATHDQSAIATVPSLTNFVTFKSLVSAAGVLPPTASQPKDVDCTTNLVVPANTPQASLTPRQQMMSSGAGALLVTLFMTPLDVVKIRQVQVLNNEDFVSENPGQTKNGK